jgi:ABC-type Fe3+/spermidine/putrescine transport system ATPase subunit
VKDADGGHIEVEELCVRYGEVTAVRQVSFTVRRGEHLTLLGPSGCGKSTLLRAIAGLERPAAGEIRIDGQPVFSSTQGINVPTEKRGLSMVFQSYAIWPHMTVFDNVAYGLRVRRLSRTQIEEAVSWALELVRLRDFADRRAANLSGGQQQRVALARSIAFSPKAVLFDEPLSNLDAKLRVEMRLEIKELQRTLGITAIYVTHDQEEALAISDQIIVMNAGGIEQVGTPGEIYDRPHNVFTADFVGSANLITGRLRADPQAAGHIALETPSGKVVYGVNDSDTARAHAPEGTFSVRTIYLQLSREKPKAEVNTWLVRITRSVFLGDVFQYVIEWGGCQLVVRRLATERFDEGEQVWLSIEPRHCVLLAG